MARNTNFLFALLIVVALAWMALAARGCSGPRVPAFIDAKLTLDEARERAKESGKPVFALVAADWCDHCAALKAGALRDSRVTSWISEHSVPVYVDVTRLQQHDPKTMEVLDQLKVDTIPAMILLDGNRQIGHVEGEMPADDALHFLESAGK